MRAILRARRPDWRVGLIVLTVKGRAIRHYIVALGAIGMMIVVLQAGSVSVSLEAIRLIEH